MSFAHDFKYENWVRENSFLGFIVASLGLILYFGISQKEPHGFKRFLKGFIGAFFYFAICLFWLCYALTNFGGLPLWLGTIVASLVCIYCALYWGLAVYICGRPEIKDQGAVLRSISWAAIVTGLEALRQWVITGFHWGELGYHFEYMTWIRSSASIWGAHGLTFFWIFLIGCILNFDQWSKSREQIKAFGLTVSIFVLGCVWSQIDLHWIRSFDRQVKVGLVQPNIAQDDKWDPQLVSQIVSNLLEATQHVISLGADIVVWPETAYPRLIGDNQRQLPFSSPVPLLMGAVVREGRINRNSALLVEGDQILSRFDKVHLVPYGEYVPFKEWMPFEKLVANVGDFIPGSRDQPLLSPPNLNLKLAPLICYEDAFNRDAVRLARQGADLFVNITNDAWYGPTSAQRQHAALAAFQVYQSFVPMVRATNNGLTTIITPQARIDGPAFERAQFVETVNFASTASKTFFVWTYPLMEWIWAIIFVIAWQWKRSRQTKRIFFRS